VCCSLLQKPLNREVVYDRYSFSSILCYFFSILQIAGLQAALLKIGCMSTQFLQFCCMKSALKRSPYYHTVRSLYQQIISLTRCFQHIITQKGIYVCAKQSLSLDGIIISSIAEIMFVPVGEIERCFHKISARKRVVILTGNVLLFYDAFDYLQIRFHSIS
jgi:hypothetical protein